MAKQQYQQQHHHVEEKKLLLRLILFVVLLSGLWGWATAIAPPAAATNEGIALIALKAGISDPEGHLANWKLNGTSTPCSWTGITCGNSSQVVGLDLSYMNLTGTVSNDLGKLTNLVNLSLACNNFTGVLPAVIVTLSKLQYVNVSNNNFSDVFPSNFSQLQSLQVCGIAAE